MKKVILFESFIAENEKETAKEIFDELMDVNGEEIADIDSQEAMTILSRRGIRGGKANKIAKELLKLTGAIGESVVNESDAALKKENKNWLIQPEPLHPNLSKKNLAKLKKLGHTGMKSAILWTDGHSSNPTYIQIPGEVGTPWGSKGPEDRTTFYWDGENVWCTNYPKETLRIDYKKSVDTAKEFSDATKSISDSGKWDKVKKM